LSSNNINKAAECTRQLPHAIYKELDQYIDSLEIDLENERRSGFLIQTLHRAQKLFGYLPEEVQRYIARRLGISHAEVSGVISFYNFFTTEPKGKFQISVCMGTACFVKGAPKILEEFEKSLKIKAGEVTEDGNYSVDMLRCVGACGLAPVVLVNDKVYGNVTPKMVGDIMADCSKLEAGNES